MSVLVLIPHWPGASEVWLRRMIDAIEGDVCAIATFSPPRKDWNGRVPVVDLMPGAARFAAKAKIKWLPGIGNGALRRILNEFNVTSVFCHYMNFAVAFSDVWKSVDVPLYIHCHGYDVTWDLRIAAFPMFRRFRPGYKGRALELAERSHVVVNSSMAKSRLVADGFSEKGITVKYIGVPVPREPRTPENTSAELNVLFLGRLVDCKGPGLTISAFDQACRLGLNAKLIIAGDGPMYSECLKLKNASPFGEQIALLGAVDAWTGEALRNSADVFTAHNCFGPASKQVESYGVSVVEAMAASLPVITGRSGGVCETVVDGETGILFDSFDIKAHAAALTLMASDPNLRHRLGEAGWRRARDKFSIEQETSQLREILGLDHAAEAGRG